MTFTLLPSGYLLIKASNADIARINTLGQTPTLAALAELFHLAPDWGEWADHRAPEVDCLEYHTHGKGETTRMVWAGLDNWADSLDCRGHAYLTPMSRPGHMEYRPTADELLLDTTERDSAGAGREARAAKLFRSTTLRGLTTQMACLSELLAATLEGRTLEHAEQIVDHLRGLENFLGEATDVLETYAQPDDRRVKIYNGTATLRVEATDEVRFMVFAENAADARQMLEEDDLGGTEDVIFLSREETHAHSLNIEGEDISFDDLAEEE